MMSLIVKKSGIYDTFQDSGRVGNRRLGVNPNGVMDRTALRIANLVLGNNEFEAVLEMHFPAPVLEFRRRISFAVAGADFSGDLDGAEVTLGRCQTAKRGSILKFSSHRAGRRCYLAVKNGFSLREWLSSMSTNSVAVAGGYEGRSLRRGDKIGLNSPEAIERAVTAGMRSGNGESSILRFVPGPDFSSITALSELNFRKAAYRISGESDRMGYQLLGAPVKLLDDSQRLSSAVTFGTIQVLPSGELILLMADHQTTGGYPNIGTVIGPDLPRAAQMGAGDTIRFKPVTISEAEKALFDYERDFSLLRNGLRLSAF